MAKGPRRFLRCLDCGLLYAREMRAGDADWYRRAWIYAPNRRSGPLSLEAIESNWAWGLFLKEAPVPKGTLLDVGCGRGDFLYAAQRRGFQVEGVEFQPELVEAGHETYGLSIHCLDLQRLLEEGRRYDVATAFEVIEHVSDPVALLEALGRIGRYVAVSVPCAERRPALYARGFDDPPHHLTFWTPTSLRLAFALAGLTPLLLRGDRYEPTHFGTYLSCLFGGRYLFGRYVRGAARRLGTGLGRLLRPKGEGAFTLFALARRADAPGELAETKEGAA